MITPVGIAWTLPFLMMMVCLYLNFLYHDYFYWLFFHQVNGLVLMDCWHCICKLSQWGTQISFSDLCVFLWHGYSVLWLIDVAWGNSNTIRGLFWYLSLNMLLSVSVKAITTFMTSMVALENFIWLCCVFLSLFTVASLR